MVTFVCETCQHLIGTADHNVGRRIRCPHCGNQALVTQPPEETVGNELSATPTFAPYANASPAATSSMPLSAAECLASRVADDPSLPVRRQIPAPSSRYRVVGFDKAIQMKVTWMVSAASREAAVETAEQGGIQVESVSPIQASADDE